LTLLKSYVEQPARSQLKAVARLQSLADRTVAPYMKNPALVGRREEGVGPGEGFSTTALGAELTFDLGKRQQLRQEAGEVRSQLHRHDARQQLLLQVCAVRAAVLDLEFAVRRLQVLEGIGERYGWLLESVATLAAGKEKSRFDLRRAELTLTTHRQRVGELAAGRDALSEELGAIVDGKVPEGLRSGVAVSLPELADVLQESRRRNPAMAAAAVLGKAAGLEERAAERSWIPDLGLYGAYRVDTFDSARQPLHGYEFGFSVALPFFRKGEEREARARASSAVERLRLDRTWDAIRTKVAAAHGSAAARFRLLQELGPGRADDSQALWDEGVKAYREGVVVLGELVELLQAEEERALARERIAHEARGRVLAMYCAAGYFPEPEMNDLISGDAP